VLFVGFCWVEVGLDEGFLEGGWKVCKGFLWVVFMERVWNEGKAIEDIGECGCHARRERRWER